VRAAAATRRSPPDTTSVTLPREAAAFEVRYETGVSRRGDEEDELHESGFGDQTILVVDGDARFQRETARALASTGLRVRPARTGSEALEAVLEESVVLVLLEVRLEDTSGYEVCRQLRHERGDALPIIFVSEDRTESSDRVAGLLLGADDYLAKPIAPDELVARVQRHLRRLQTWNGAGVRLTRREREVLQLLAEGLGPAEIGLKLGVTQKTVATHVEHIYAKLGVHTRAQAVASAFRHFLVEV
jgi:DNA-binding NarL/FixJ family response regulator